MITAEFSICSAVWEALSPISSLCRYKTSQCFSAIFMAYINVLVRNDLKNSMQSCRADVEHFKVAITMGVLSWGQASRWVLECVCGNICKAVTSDSLQLSLSASPDIMTIHRQKTAGNLQHDQIIYLTPLRRGSSLMFSRNRFYTHLQ